MPASLFLIVSFIFFSQAVFALDKTLLIHGNFKEKGSLVDVMGRHVSPNMDVILKGLSKGRLLYHKKKLSTDFG
ncbi:MAG: hypothetical protein OXE99_03775 [Cellvibrionales bacterium]|nr:hypothetical protein [Cellvibrionales bacterium]